MNKDYVPSATFCTTLEEAIEKYGAERVLFNTNRMAKLDHDNAARARKNAEDLKAFKEWKAAQAKG